jgi:ankyrin repeat protein
MGDTLLMIESSYENNIETIKLLIDNNVNINAKNNKGNTALINASNNNFEIVKLLIDSGVNVNDTNNKGESPLLITIMNIDYADGDIIYIQNCLIAKLLIDNGAENIFDKIPDENPIKVELIAYMEVREPIFK